MSESYFTGYASGMYWTSEVGKGGKNAIVQSFVSSDKEKQFSNSNYEIIFALE